ncbi:MAG: DUF4056 domain-containing protein [Sedimentisphaerales bacterium]|nr:DUF4056 domain-containing protein [Sedimentisphaerales bacterium]
MFRISCFGIRICCAGVLAGAPATLVAGCSHPATWLGFKDSLNSPRIRMSCYPTASVGTVWAHPDNLGEHDYATGRREKDGMLYTCRGGHIDTPHVRKAADWTAYLAGKALTRLNKGDTKFSFKLWEPTRYYVTVDYPPGWKQLAPQEKERIAREVSIPLGQYLAFNALTWHEIVTWFGYRPTPWYPEFPSAFSWEDTFSNLVGTRLAVEAMRDASRPYNEAMTVALEAELHRLGVQPRDVAIRAAKAVKGTWYTGEFLFLVDIRKRNLDIGLDDGMVTASVVPDLPECPDAEPQSYPAPSLDFLSAYDFSVKFEIEPRELEKGKILKIVYPNRKDRKKRIEPALHFASIMEYIRQDAARRFGDAMYFPEGDPDRSE